MAAISRLFWEHLALDAEQDPNAKPGHQGYLPAILGVLERLLYIAALLAGFAEFIGVWLVLKVAGGWEGWSKGREKVLGRHLFNASMVSSALSLLWAVVGTAMILWLQGGRADLAIASGAAVLTATYLFWLALWLWRRRRSIPNKALHNPRLDRSGTPTASARGTAGAVATDKEA
jgi:hypothetical protein